MDEAGRLAGIETRRKTLPAARSVPKTRAAEQAYDAIESLIATLRLAPGSAVVESELIQLTGLGRTPVREALMRLLAIGLIEQQPRRGLRISDIRLAEHLVLIDTRRVLERLIAAGAARRATPAQREAIRQHAQRMAEAATAGDLDGYMQADQGLDHVCHDACRNPYAVQAVTPLTVRCRRFWYAYQYEGDLAHGAECHRVLAERIAQGKPDEAANAAEVLMDYLEAFTRKIIE